MITEPFPGHGLILLFLFIGLSCILFRYNLPAVLDIEALGIKS